MGGAPRSDAARSSITGPRTATAPCDDRKGGRRIAFLGESKADPLPDPLIVERPIPCDTRRRAKGWTGCDLALRLCEPSRWSGDERAPRASSCEAFARRLRRAGAASLPSCEGIRCCPPDLAKEPALGWSSESGPRCDGDQPRGDTVSMDLRQIGGGAIWSGYRPAVREPRSTGCKRMGYTARDGRLATLRSVRGAVPRDHEPGGRVVLVLSFLASTSTRFGGTSANTRPSEHRLRTRRKGRLDVAILFLDGGDRPVAPQRLGSRADGAVAVEAEHRTRRGSGRRRPVRPGFTSVAGSAGRDDALLSYKLGFSRLTRPFRTMNVVADRGGVRRAGAALGSGSTEGGFFLPIGPRPSPAPRPRPSALPPAELRGKRARHAASARPMGGHSRGPAGHFAAPQPRAIQCRIRRSPLPQGAGGGFGAGEPLGY